MDLCFLLKVKIINSITLRRPIYMGIRKPIFDKITSSKLCSISLSNTLKIDHKQLDIRLM